MTPAEEAHHSVRKDPSFIIDRFASLESVPPVQNPVTFFMAGAPGAGKTEWAQSFSRQMLESDDPQYYFVHIDADEIRKLFPGYNGLNVREYERATSLAVGKLIDSTHKFGQNVIVDGTLSRYSRAEENIETALTKHGRGTAIFFVYQKPELAWKFTLARKGVDGREVDRDKFITSYVDSLRTANSLKNKYGKRVRLNIIEKNEFNKVKRFHFNVGSIDGYVEKVYDIDELEQLIQ